MSRVDRRSRPYDPELPTAQFVAGGCQRASRPSRFSRSIACTVPASASGARATAARRHSNSRGSPRCRNERSPKRDRSCQSRTGVFAIDAAIPSRATRSRFLVAELVDELQIDRLPAGEHAAVGDAIERIAVELAPRPAPSPGTRRRNPARSTRVAARASGLVGSKPLGAALSGDDFTSSTLTPTVFSRSVTFGYWKITPIEPTSEVLCATMWSRRHRGDVAARRGKAVDHHHHRLRAANLAQRVVKLLGAGGRAARTVDVHDDRLRRRSGRAVRAPRPARCRRG